MRLAIIIVAVGLLASALAAETPKDSPAATQVSDSIDDTALQLLKVKAAAAHDALAKARDAAIARSHLEQMPEYERALADYQAAQEALDGAGKNVDARIQAATERANASARLQKLKEKLFASDPAVTDAEKADAAARTELAEAQIKLDKAAAAQTSNHPTSSTGRKTTTITKYDRFKDHTTIETPELSVENRGFTISLVAWFTGKDVSKAPKEMALYIYVGDNIDPHELILLVDGNRIRMPLKGYSAVRYVSLDVDALGKFAKAKTIEGEVSDCDFNLTPESIAKIADFYRQIPHDE